jgi:hypothetical protein
MSKSSDKFIDPDLLATAEEMNEQYRAAQEREEWAPHLNRDGLVYLTSFTRCGQHSRLLALVETDLLERFEIYDPEICAMAEHAWQEGIAVRTYVRRRYGSGVRYLTALKYAPAGDLESWPCLNCEAMMQLAKGMYSCPNCHYMTKPMPRRPR